MSLEKYFVVRSIFQPQEVPFQDKKKYIYAVKWVFNTANLKFFVSPRNFFEKKILLTKFHLG